MPDSLTGLGDHADFQAALAGARAHSSVAVLLISADDLVTSDRQRRELVAALSGVLRESDELFRVGPDEFAVPVHLSADGQATEAVEVARRLHEAVTATSSLAVSISAAVVLERESGTAALDRAAHVLHA